MKKALLLLSDWMSGRMEEWKNGKQPASSEGVPSVQFFRLPTFRKTFTS
ncbi:MAG: hypothetical protein HY063_02990 [Bacteroidetes bacterium]|nr:hypothetical protein [Bacteroidota bacterium]